MILGQAATACVGRAEVSLDVEEGMLDLRPQQSPLGDQAVRRELPAAAGTHRDPPSDLRAGVFWTPLHTPITGIAPGLASPAFLFRL